MPYPDADAREVFEGDPGASAFSAGDDGTVPGDRNACKAWAESGAKAAVGDDHVDRRRRLPGHRAVISHRRPAGGELCEWKREHNRFHEQVRAGVERVLARMKTWKILRDCRLKGEASTTPYSASPALTTSSKPHRSDDGSIRSEHETPRDRLRETRTIKLKTGRKRPRPLTAVQVRTPQDACELLRDRLLFALLLGTGVRIGEALGLRHDDLAVTGARSPC